MKQFELIVSKLSILLENLSTYILVFMMFLVVTDVILRIFGHPIVGTYEMVMILAGPLVAFAIPQTSVTSQHISVDFLVEQIENRSARARNIMFICTKLLGITLFLVIGWFCIQKGFWMFEKGDITDARHIPLFPVAFVMGACCFCEALVLLVRVIKTFKGERS